MCIKLEMNQGATGVLLLAYNCFVPPESINRTIALVLVKVVTIVTLCSAITAIVHKQT